MKCRRFYLRFASPARGCPFHPRGGLFWADQGRRNLGSSGSIIFHLWEPKRGKGDEAFCQIRTPLLTVKQWNPDFSEDTRYRECKPPLHASSLIFSSAHKSTCLPSHSHPKGQGVPCHTCHSNVVAFHGPGCLDQARRVRKNNTQWLKREAGSSIQ